MIRFRTSRPSSRTIGKAPLKLRRFVPTGLMMAVMVVLCYQALQGNRGLRGWQNLEQEHVTKRQDLLELKQINQQLQVQIARLRPDTLDTDYLDERARIVLGLVGSNEVVIFNQHLRSN